MKKRRLTKILVDGNGDLLHKLATQIEESYSINIEREAKTGLVMMKVRDSVSMQPFYMGELLITECTVSINDVFGFGMIKGEEFKRAYQLAVVDAALNAKVEEIKTNQWLAELDREEAIIQKGQQKEEALVAQSKVHFDTMEDYNGKS